MLAYVLFGAKFTIGVYRKVPEIMVEYNENVHISSKNVRLESLSRIDRCSTAHVRFSDITPIAC